MSDVLPLSVQCAMRRMRSDCTKCHHNKGDKMRGKEKDDENLARKNEE